MIYLAQNRKFQDFVETKYLADNAVTEAKVGGLQMHTLKFVYDGTSLTTGAKTLTDATGAALTLPAGAIIHSYMIDAEVPFGSAGSATIALGITGAATALLGATAFDNAALIRETSHFRHPSAGSLVLAESSVLLTIAGAALQSGLANVYISYMNTV